MKGKGPSLAFILGLYPLVVAEGASEFARRNVGTPVFGGMIVTEDEGKAMFRKELSLHEAAVRRLVTVDLTQGQFDALVSFTFNLGQGALRTSTRRTPGGVGSATGAYGRITDPGYGRAIGVAATVRGGSAAGRAALTAAAGRLANAVDEYLNGLYYKFWLSGEIGRASCRERVSSPV